jgi:subtilisin
MKSSENRYVILPKRGFKSGEMSALDKPRRSSGVMKPLSAPGRSAPIKVQIVDSISKTGPKVAEMTSFEAQEIRHLDQFRVVPIRKYKPARRPLSVARRKALSSRTGNPVQTRIFVKEAGTDKPLGGVVVIAIVDRLTNAGVRRRTGQTGQTTITLPGKPNLAQLYVYPPPGYWGKYVENTILAHDDTIYLAKLDSDHLDYLRHLHNTPSKGRGKGVKVAIIDTGVDTSHPDLQLDVVKNCVASENPNDLQPSDGHGTHVAGIVGGKSHGVAPGVTLCSYKVFPHHGSATNVDIARAIDWAVDDKCDLINLSLGGGRPDETLSEAIGYAFENGVVCIAAAGNQTRSPVAYPAWFKRCIAVAALGREGCFPRDAIEVADISTDRSKSDRDVFFAAFSNLGREVDMCAPGVGIVSTWTGGGYAVESGTSMACPVVTGIGASLLAVDKDVLHLNRGVERSLKIIQLIQSKCQSLGLPQIFEGLGQPVLD